MGLEFDLVAIFSLVYCVSDNFYPREANRETTEVQIEKEKGEEIFARCFSFFFSFFRTANSTATPFLSSVEHAASIRWRLLFFEIRFPCLLSGTMS